MSSELLYLFAMKHTSWDSWYDSSPVQTLLRARDNSEHLGVTSEKVRKHLEKAMWGQETRYTTAATRQKAQDGFQAQAYALLLTSDAYDHEANLRKKLARWRVKEVPPGTLARRASRLLRHAFTLAPPRVANALFRTWLNGWCTARRFQVKKARCVFECPLGSNNECQDSIEHYTHCRVIRNFALETLKLPPHVVGTPMGLLCLRGLVEDETRTIQLLLVYAVYTAANIIRHGNARPDSNSLTELLLQLMHQGAGQSSSAQGALRRCLGQRKHKQRRVNPSVAVPITRFVQGGDHFMTTSFDRSAASEGLPLT